MGLEKILKVYNDDVFIRTELGAQEIDNVSASELPRKARTLLILIDGRKSHAQVTRLLENRAMFKSAGELNSYLKMLMDLNYVKPPSSNVKARFGSGTSQRRRSRKINPATPASNDEYMDDEISIAH